MPSNDNAALACLSKITMAFLGVAYELSVIYLPVLPSFDLSPWLNLSFQRVSFVSLNFVQELVPLLPGHLTSSEQENGAPRGICCEPAMLGAVIHLLQFLRNK